VTGAPLKGRTFLVTGANSGIGLALADALCAGGGSVVLAARSEERTAPVLEAMARSHPGADVSFLQVDVADFDSVRRAAGRFLASGRALDVLVNNAGVAGTEGLSRDGFDITYATNHLGPFLLTRLLLPRLEQSPAARIVNVSSMAHMQIKRIEWGGIERRTTPKRSGFHDYAMTKLMNIMHASELARRLAGTRVTTYSLHPGAVASNVWRALPEPFQWILKLFLLSNEKGARTPFFCATAPELEGVSGRYYNHSREARASALAGETSLWRELWSRSEAAVG
jgi:dehydrogenase/reductase SDR family protein 13